MFHDSDFQLWYLVPLAFAALFLRAVLIKAKGGVITAPNEEPYPEEFEGEAAGTKYLVGCYYQDRTMTVQIDVPKELAKKLEVNARDGAPRLPVDDPRLSDVKILLDLGFNFVEVGYNSARAAAELPKAKGRIDAALAERVVPILVRLRDTTLSM